MKCCKVQVRGHAEHCNAFFASRCCAALFLCCIEQHSVCTAGCFQADTVSCVQVFLFGTERCPQHALDKGSRHVTAVTAPTMPWQRASLQLRSQESSGATFGNNIPRYYSLLRHGWSWGAKLGCTMYTIPCPFDDQGHYSKYAHAPAVDESTSCVKARTITSNFWVCGSTFSLCCSMQQAQGECHHIITESWRKQPKVG